MLFIFFFSLLFFILLTGFGKLTGKVLKIVPENIWIYPWLGFFGFSICSICYSLLLPLNWIPLAILSVGAVYGLLLLGPEFGREYKKSTFHPIIAIVFAIFFVCACILAYKTWPDYAFDTDLYHANILSWLKEYGIVPGLGNLHSRLANNSAWLYTAALLDTPLGGSKIAWIMPALSYTFYFLYLMHCTFFEKNKLIKLYTFFLLVFLIPSFLKIRVIFPNLYYDNPSLFLIAICVGECLRTLFITKEKIIPQLKLCGCLIAAAYMVKPNAAFSVIMIVLFICGITLQNKIFTLRNMINILFPAAIAAALWVSANIILSGYPLFPLSIISVSADWAMPQEAVTEIYNSIVGWARRGDVHLESVHGWNWLYPWFLRHLSKSNYLLYLWGPFLVGAVVWALVLIRNVDKTRLFFFIWCFGNLVFWFLSAPDMRFGREFFPIFLAVGCAFYFEKKIKVSDFLQLDRKALSRCSALIFMLFVCTGIVRMHSPDRALLTVEDIPSRAGIARILDYTPQDNTPIFLYKPLEDFDGRCGNSPLPCAPSDVSLGLRIQGNLGKGFYHPKQ